METLLKLAQARIEKGLTQAAVAEYVDVSIATICRWEKGTMRPYPRHMHKLCTLFGKTAFELGLTHVETETVSSAPLPVEARLKEDHAFVKWFRRDLELRLDCLMHDWFHSKKPSSSYAMLQYRLSQELKDDDSMTNEPNKQPYEGVDEARRESLRRLALVPIYALGLGAIEKASTWAPEDLLAHCAAGVTACEHLAKGQHEDMALASSVLATYLTPLKEIVEQYSLHRKQAAELVAHALLIKAKLSVHKEGPKRAINYGKQAEIYSKESGNISLNLAILNLLVWIYTCDSREKQALEAALQAKFLLPKQQSREDPFIHPITYSDTYSEVAISQARNGQDKEALLTIRSAYDTFFAPDAKENITYDDFNYSTLILSDGLTHYHLGQYEKALEIFAQAVDLETLDPKVSASSVRVRVEIINNETLTSLKSPKKDMELSMRLWTAGMQGAIDLRSEQRFGEALTAYDIMQALWPSDQRIRGLRDLIRHW